jgi:hypothetical protein
MRHGHYGQYGKDNRQMHPILLYLMAARCRVLDGCALSRVHSRPLMLTKNESGQRAYPFAAGLSCQGSR